MHIPATIFPELVYLSLFVGVSIVGQQNTASGGVVGMMR